MMMLRTDIRPALRASSFALLLLFTAAFGLACSDDILGENENGSLRGTVFDDGGGNTPLNGVTLFLVNRETTTGVDGRYEFTGIPVGTQRLTAFKNGYQDYSANVQIQEDDAEDPFANRHSFFMRFDSTIK
ncbi:hypothetical protein GF377_08825 [candidate division GN15 bacterium]|nr:hypothetical protein [candidate division GN15 bacterium]